jgi:predicted nucleic acid-binding protein
MVIVDTTVWIDYFRAAHTPQTDWLDFNLDHQRLGLGDLILCEVLQGIRDEKEAERTRRALFTLEIVDMAGIDTAIAAARNYRTLRARGQTIRKTIDCLIATSCLLQGNSLLHSDRDFDAFEQWLGLLVVHP